MDYLKLASLYAGKEVTLSQVMFVDHSDGNGVQIEKWEVPDTLQPSIAQLEAFQPQVEIIENDIKLKEQIINLEVGQPRALREFALGLEGAQQRLQELDNEISALRAQLSK